ncbi:MAG: GNAT family N-acetyltransferase [Acidobacteriaceae bacterium]|nr:GNAT family N-acetyltransferase [Acidobacteriaceae bacterium]MBV9227516.1 GNAT family N-acetyltransferase [Acidobacteriaceae bacterium]MBV9307648.1 GNAT family N-acetyltransferase [Acidobacteriaceae bacterium]MBV9679866.1 GNAT family N-acetyltransferase [Acidobacteriaceae bacterium]MBV9938378.1 GNAT family N-acetyltransferase [Acidobacteriaceae bacterium]
MGPASTYEIHQLTTLEEFSAVVRLQREIWGFQDVELLPRRLFVVASKIGGQLLGAFDDSKMVGFCLCIPGLKPNGKPYLHSHMLGVLPPYRNTGLGRRLKLKQREYALEQGIDLIEWTFDPLELKNAFFNIERLGAIVRRYVHNQYGTTSSHLHGGLPTDRLIAEWWLQSPRAVAVGGEGERSFGGDPAEARISVPADIAETRLKDPGLARKVQADIGEQFQNHFERGLAVTGFERNNTEGVYLLSLWPSK